jgi:hypothetical protein
MVLEETSKPRANEILTYAQQQQPELQRSSGKSQLLTVCARVRNVALPGDLAVDVSAIAAKY